MTFDLTIPAERRAYKQTFGWYWSQIKLLCKDAPAIWRFTLAKFLTANEGWFTRTNWHMIAGNWKTPV